MSDRIAPCSKTQSTPGSSVCRALGVAAAVTSRTTCRILEPFRAGRWPRPARSKKTGTRPTTRGSRPANLVWALAFTLGRVLEQDGYQPSGRRTWSGETHKREGDVLLDVSLHHRGPSHDFRSCNGGHEPLESQRVPPRALGKNERAMGTPARRVRPRIQRACGTSINRCRHDHISSRCMSKSRSYCGVDRKQTAFP